MAAKPKASFALVDADAAPAADLSNLRLRPSERRPKGEAAPLAALETRAPGADMFFQKGDASASTFRPSYWTYERHPEAEAPRAPAAEPALVATLTRPVKRPIAAPASAPAPAASPVVTKALVPVAAAASPVATKLAKAPSTAGAPVAPMASLSNLGFMGKSKAQVATAENVEVAKALLAHQSTLKESDFEEIDPPLETTANYLPAPIETAPAAAQSPTPAAAAPKPVPAQPTAKAKARPAAPPPSAAVASPPSVRAAVKATSKAEAPAPEKSVAPAQPAALAPPQAKIATLAPAVPEKAAAPAPTMAPAAPTTTSEPPAAEPPRERATPAAPSLEPALAARTRDTKMPPPVVAAKVATTKPAPAALAARKPEPPPAPKIGVAPPAAPAASETDASQTAVARSVIRELRDRFRRTEQQAEEAAQTQSETSAPAPQAVAAITRPIVPVAAPAMAKVETVQPHGEIEKPRAAPAARSTILPALPERAVAPVLEVPPAPSPVQRKAEPKAPTTAPVAPTAPKPVAAPGPSAFDLEIEIDAAAEERRVAAEIADTLGSAIESVLASKWYGAGEWQGAPPPAPAASDRPMAAPTITHEGLMAELAVARLLTNTGGKAERGNRGVAVVCVLMLALATFFGLSLWRNHANPFVSNFTSSVLR